MINLKFQICVVRTNNLIYILRLSWRRLTLVEQGDNVDITVLIVINVILNFLNNSVIELRTHTALGRK